MMKRSRRKGSFSLLAIFVFIMIFVLSGCGSQGSGDVILDDPNESSVIIAVPTFTLTPTPAPLIPTASPDLQGGFIVEILALEESSVRIVIDQILEHDGRLREGGFVQEYARDLLEIQTSDIDSLQIFINGEEQIVKSERGQSSTYIWHAADLNEEASITLTPESLVISTPLPPLYQLEEGNASEPITMENAVRLMDLVHLDIGSSYEFEPAFSADGLFMSYKARMTTPNTSSEEPTSEDYFNMIELNTGIVSQIVEPGLRSNVHRIDGAAFHPVRDELLVYGDSTTSRVIFGEDGSIQVSEIHRYNGGVSLTGQVYSPDGEYLLRTSFTGAVFLYRDHGWREEFSTVVEPYSYLEGVYINWRPALDPGFTDDGRYFAVIGEGLQIWNTNDYSLHFKSEGAYYQDTSHLAMHGSEIAAVAPGNIYFLDIESKTISHILPAPSSVTALDYSTDGSMIAVGTGSGGLFFYDPRTNRTVTSRQAHAEKITHLIFSPDGRWLATVSEDGTIALWAIP